MARVDVAIKELFSEALAEVREEQLKLNERCTSLEEQLKEVTSKLHEKTEEADALRSDVQQKAATIQELDSRVKALEGFGISALVGRVERLEDDPSGLGGLRQALQKVQELETRLAEGFKAISENSNIARTAKDRTDKFDSQLRDYDRQRVATEGQVLVFDERLNAVETMSSQVRDQQQKVEDIEAGLESTLRNEILHSLEDFKTKQLQALRAEIDVGKKASVTRTKSLVNGALELVARAHAERKDVNVKGHLIMGWRQQAWISSRRKMGLLVLHHFSQRRSRCALTQWTRVASSEALVCKLRDELSANLASESSAVKDSLTKRCEQLDADVNTIRTEHGRGYEELRKNGEAVDAKIDAKIRVIDAVRGQVEDHAQKLQDHAQKLQERTEKATDHEEHLASIHSRHEEVSKSLVELLENTKDVAKKGEMMRDLVLIWNSLKQLDSAKCCKADMDALTLESANREKLVIRRIEDMEKAISSVSTSKLGENDKDKWDDVHNRLEESSRQMENWKQMWERLAGFVEDLVQKVGELQQGGGDDPAKTSSTIRPGSAGTFPSNSRGQQKIPHLTSTSAASNASDTTAPLSGASDGQMETKKLWTSSSKSLLAESGREGSVPPPKQARGQRPHSASARRSHDRPLGR